MVQISVPLCVRDQDLDGRSAHLPVRSLTAGEGPHYREARPTVLTMVDPAGWARAGATSAAFEVTWTGVT